MWLLFEFYLSTDIDNIRIDPTRQHGSKTYKKYFDRGYDYDTNTPTVLYRLYCYWCDGFMYIVEYPDP